MPLTSEQKALLKELGLPTNFKNLSTDGRLCESILEALED